MKLYGIVIYTLFVSVLGNAHNIKILKSQSSDLDSSGIEAAFNNESKVKDDVTFFEGSVGGLRTNNNYDGSVSESKSFSLLALTPEFLSLGLSVGMYDNSTEELKTRTVGGEIGKKYFYGEEDTDGFKPNFGFKVKGERVTIDQSRTFPRLRRTFEFSLEQTSTNLALSYSPVAWLEVSASHTKNSYNKDMSSVKSALSRSEFISSLFSNVQNTVASLSDKSQSVSIRLLPDKEFDTSFTRTFSNDLLTDTQYYVDSVDLGIYYFSRLHVFLSAGESYSTKDTGKSSFNELSLQINF